MSRHGHEDLQMKPRSNALSLNGVVRPFAAIVHDLAACGQVGARICKEQRAPQHRTEGGCEIFGDNCRMAEFFLPGQILGTASLTMCLGWLWLCRWLRLCLRLWLHCCDGLRFSFPGSAVSVFAHPQSTEALAMMIATLGHVILISILYHGEALLWPGDSDIGQFAAIHISYQNLDPIPGE